MEAIKQINCEKRERTKCERYSRIVGYLRPLQQWNDGKQAEWHDRKLFNVMGKAREMTPIALACCKEKEEM